MGTAVKAESGVSHRNKLGKPFTSDLSGQDFWTLMQTGHIPQGLVMGTCVYHIAHRGLGATLGSAGQNVELPNFTQALYEARELAMTRMQDEANELGASGIVGVRLEEKSHQWGSHTIEFLSLGTAVVKTVRRGHPAHAHHHHLARQLMTVPAESSPGDLPEAAVRRFAEGAFTSGLTVPDFAACLQMGLEPVGFAQGYCVMQWQWYGMSPMGGAASATSGAASAATPRPGTAPTAWSPPSTGPGARTTSSPGWRTPGRRGSPPPTTAWSRRPPSAGAHGDRRAWSTRPAPLADMGVLEFQVQGTAVRVADGPPAGRRPAVDHLPGRPTPGQAGRGRLRPGVDRRVGGLGAGVGQLRHPVPDRGLQLDVRRRDTRAPRSSRRSRPRRRPASIATERIRGQLGHDSLHGASMTTTQRELGEGDAELQCILRGNRVRRFKEFDPMPAPRPTVRLL